MDTLYRLARRQPDFVPFFTCQRCGITFDYFESESFTLTLKQDLTGRSGSLCLCVLCASDILRDALGQ